MTSELTQFQPITQKAQINELLSVDGLDEALRKLSFTQDEFIKLLITHARSDNSKISLGALNLLWKVNNDTLRLNGMIASGRVERENEDGSRQVVQTTKLIDRIRQDNPHAQNPQNHISIPARDHTLDAPSSSVPPDPGTPPSNPGGGPQPPP